MKSKARLRARTLVIAIAVAVGVPLLGSPTAAISGTPPTTPTDLRAYGTTEFGVFVTWQPSTDTDPFDDTIYYNIYAETDGYNAVVSRSSSSANPPKFTRVYGRGKRLQPDTTYTITVRARDRDGRLSPPSNAVTVTTKPVDPPLPVPTNLRVTRNETGTELSVAWDVADDPRVDATIARLNGRWIRKDSDTSATAINLDPRTDYTLEVRSVWLSIDARWEGEPGVLQVRTSPDTVAPSQPSRVRAVDRTGTSITLRWDKSRDNHAVTDYLVSNGETTKVVPATFFPTFEFTGLAPDTLFTFTIRARDAEGNLSEPTAFEFATGVDPDTEPPAPVTGLDGFAEVFNGEVFLLILDWDRSTDNVTLQRHLRYRLSFENGTSALLDKDQTSFDDERIPGLTLGCVPTVQAVDAEGNHSEPRSIRLCDLS